MSEWIRVEERLPAEYELSLVYGSSGIFIGSYRKGNKYMDGYWCSEKYEHVECTEDYEPVTYWMPLPQPPKETL